VYESAKERLGGNREGYHVAATATSGAIATLVNDACMTPADVIKQRLQVQGGGWAAGRLLGLCAAEAPVAGVLGRGSRASAALRLRGACCHRAVAAGDLAPSCCMLWSATSPTHLPAARLQVAHSPYTGIWDCLKRVLQAEGPSAFFKSYRWGGALCQAACSLHPGLLDIPPGKAPCQLPPLQPTPLRTRLCRTTIVMNIPFTAMHFSVYEAAKKWLLGLENADGQAAEEEEEGLAVQLVAGGLAGGAAAAVSVAACTLVALVARRCSGSSAWAIGAASPI
jgi:solute carrier family 25 iron transporter 28/37